MIFDKENWLWKSSQILTTSKFGNFIWLQLMLSQKNLSNFVSLPWKLHNRYCHTVSSPQTLKNVQFTCNYFATLVLSYCTYLRQKWKHVTSTKYYLNITFFLRLTFFANCKIYAQKSQSLFSCRHRENCSYFLYIHW